MTRGTIVAIETVTQQTMLKGSYLFMVNTCTLISLSKNQRGKCPGALDLKNSPHMVFVHFRNFNVLISVSNFSYECT